MNYHKFCCCVQAVNMLKTTRPLHLTRWVAAPWRQVSGPLSRVGCGSVLGMPGLRGRWRWVSNYVAFSRLWPSGGSGGEFGSFLGIVGLWNFHTLLRSRQLCLFLFFVACSLGWWGGVLGFQSHNKLHHYSGLLTHLSCASTHTQARMQKNIFALLTDRSQIKTD